MPTRSRIEGLDLARALAVFGMVVVNFKIVLGAETAGSAWLVWVVGLLDGRAAATFVVLAGVGISLLSHRARVSRNRPGLAADRNTLLRRALFLFVVGLAYTPIWPADILHFYGLYLATAAFLLGAPTQRLLSIAVWLAAGFVALVVMLDYEAGWNGETLEYSGFWTLAGLARHMVFNGFHPVVPWLAFLLVGMALGRVDLTDATIRQRLLRGSLAGIAIGEGVSWGLRSLVATVAMPASSRADLLAVVGTAPMPPMPLYMVAGAATAVTVILVSVDVAERWREAAWVRSLVATGQLALTLYVAHVLIGMGTLELLGVSEDQTLAFTLLAAGAFCAVGVAFSTLWRRRFQRGPLEWVMRRVTEPAGTPRR
jgi:uncharacterized membrane protein YeiB